jgi:hypothetical protein
MDAVKTGGECDSFFGGFVQRIGIQGFRYEIWGQQERWSCWKARLKPV